MRTFEFRIFAMEYVPRETDEPCYSRCLSYGRACVSSVTCAITEPVSSPRLGDCAANSRSGTSLEDLSVKGSKKLKVLPEA